MNTSKKSQLPTLLVVLVVSLGLASYIKYVNQDSPQSPSTAPVQGSVNTAANEPSQSDSTQIQNAQTQTEGSDAQVNVSESAIKANEGQEVKEELLASLREQLPQFNFTTAKETDVEGLYQIESDGRILYVNNTAEYIFDGALIRIKDRFNMTDAAAGRLHIGLINSIDEKDMLIYEPDQPSNRSITVFTDISCGYCRLLHEEMDQLLDAGLRVRYLLFPRAGRDTQAHKDLESVWCADNPQEAMTNAKAGGVIEPKTCDNPIEAHMELANQVGLRGTPLIYTDSGDKLSGYREASVLSAHVLESEPLVVNN